MTRSTIPRRFHQEPLRRVVKINDHVLSKVRVEKQKPPDAVATPWPTLNRFCMGAGGRKGLAHGHQVLIAATSSKGKTTVALNLIVKAAREGENVLLIALESDLEDTTSRLAAIASGTPLSRLTRGRDFDVETDKSACDILWNLPGRVFMNEAPIYGLNDIEEVIRAYHEQYDCRTFVIDHLQLAQSGNEKQIFDRVTEISHVTRNLAASHKILSIGLSQLNRAASLNYKQCPSIYSLQGGSCLENDANLVLLIDHCRKHFKKGNQGKTAQTDLIIGKNRHGPTGRIPIHFDYLTASVSEQQGELTNE